MTQTLLIQLPEDAYQALTRIAGETGAAPEELAAQWVVNAAHTLTDDPLLEAIGSIQSIGGDVPADWADNHDKYIGEALAREMHPVEDKNQKDG
jgi:hypothetical protein